MNRRTLLAGTAAALLFRAQAQARTIQGKLPWAPNAADPPQPVSPGPWKFFTPEEGAAMEAIVDRIIPPDEHYAGGKDAGCATFIDAQLAGPFGSNAGLYNRPPFMAGAPTQGDQSPDTPAIQYRRGLAAIDAHAKAASAGKTFRELPPDQQDQILTEMERGSLQLEGISAKVLFERLVKDTKQGFLSDPVYGGNRDMVGWKMVGFPGARYDYSDWITHHNERYPLPPVSIGGRVAWTRKG